MRTLKLASLLAVLCLLGSAAAHHHGGCLYVENIVGLPRTCGVCYRSQPNAPKSVGCGKPTGVQDYCMFYRYYIIPKKNLCVRCVENYALDLKTFKCTPGKIKGCNAEFIYPDGVRRCFSCTNAFAEPFQGSYKCTPWSEASVKIPHCLSGGISGKGADAGTRYCSRCETGYTATIGTTKCEPTQIEGCLRVSSDPNRCAECNVFEGFSQQPDYSCLKVGADAVVLETQK